MSGSNKIIVDSKKNISDEKLEISVKTFFGHEITVVEESGDYKVKSTGIKGLGDKILWFIYAPTLESRKAAVEKSLKDNNSQILNEKNKSNNVGEQDPHKTITTSDDLNKTNQFLSEKKSEDDFEKSENSSSEKLEQSKDSENIKYDNNAHEESSPKIGYDSNIKIAGNLDDSNFQLFSNLEDNIKDQTNINNDNRNNSFIKERESGNIYNEFSIFNDENNIINSGKGKNLARTDVNNTGHDNSVLSKEELAEIEGQINNLRKAGGYTEEDLVLLKQNLIEEAIEKKKMDRENLEYQQQVENIIKQSKSENENIEKIYKEAESNLEKMMPEGYRMTSKKTRDEIKGDGNCFYRAIAKLENENQEKYGEIRKTISNEIDNSFQLAEKSANKIDNNLFTLIQFYAGEYSELKGVEIHKNNLDVSLLQIREHVEGKDKKNEYAGPIEAYFYAKATKKAVIIYDSNNQISVFIPGEDGNSVNVKHMAPDKIESYIKKNNIDITAAVKLAYNAVGRHYEAIVQDVKN